MGTIISKKYTALRRKGAPQVIALQALRLAEKKEGE